MAEQPTIDYTSIDWETILSDLKTYLKNTDTFKDADFEGSNIAAIMELISYVGAMNSYYLNAAANEVFLPTSRLYKNLNKIAKLVGYHPRGYRSSELDLVLSLDTDYVIGNEETTFYIPSYSQFTSTKSDSSGSAISFVNPQDITYRIRGFGTNYVEKDDITYGTQPLSVVVETDSTKNLKKQDFSIDLSQRLPFIKLGTDAKIQQTVTSALRCETTGDIKRDTEYSLEFSSGSPYSLRIAEVDAGSEATSDEILRFQHDSVTGTIIVTQNYAQGQYYLGYLGQKNLDSVSINYLETGSRVGKIEFVVNQNSAPYKVLIDGDVYSFPSGATISSPDLEDGKFSNVTDNLNLILKVSGSPNQNFTSELVLKDGNPKNKEVSVATISQDTINLDGNLPYSEIGNMITWRHLEETVKINNLKQGTPQQTIIFEDGSVSSEVDDLDVIYDSEREKYHINTEKISYDNIRVFAKSTSGITEWQQVSTTEPDLDPSSEVFFARINADQKLEIWFGDGTRGKRMRGNRFSIVGLQTSGAEGNIKSDSVENITITGFSGRNFKTQQHLQSGIRSSPVLTDSTESSVDYNIKQGYGGVGGANPENIEELRDNIGRFERTQDTIVSQQDYIDFLNENYGNILADVNVVNYRQAANLDVIAEDELEKYFFNTVFVIGVPQIGRTVLQYQKDQIIENIQEKFRSMLTPTHVFLDATIIPIDVLIRYKRAEDLRRSKTTVESEIKNKVNEFFDRNDRQIGEKIFHSNLVQKCLISGVSSVELMMNKDTEKEFVASDYNTNIETDDYESQRDLDALKSQLLRELGENGILKKYQPLFDVEETVDPDAGTTERKWSQGNDIYMNQREFPVLGDIVLEEET